MIIFQPKWLFLRPFWGRTYEWLAFALKYFLNGWKCGQFKKVRHLKRTFLACFWASFDLFFQHKWLSKLKKYQHFTFQDVVNPVNLSHSRVSKLNLLNSSFFYLVQIFRFHQTVYPCFSIFHNLWSSMGPVRKDLSLKEMVICHIFQIY